MAATVCPKCGYQQHGGVECHRCGIIFERYNPVQRPPDWKPPDPLPKRTTKGLFRLIYRVFCWLSLAGLIIGLFLMLRPSAPPPVSVTPEAVQRANSKVRQFQASLQEARGETLEMDESELNGWLGSNLALQRPSAGTASPPARAEHVAPSGRNAASAGGSDAPTIEQVRSSVRDVRIKLKDDTLLAYVSFDLYGKNLSLELEGHLTVRDGCLRLDPTGGRLGSLPLLSGTLESAAQRLFDSPENRETFRLPPDIRDVRIEHGRFVVSSR
ncbi:MAG TPA: hypothetical protein VE398_13020 [Acidobacteriota bacterium]|nr:hypothetical protein [Acidobacteriota bacterium]